MLQGRTGAIDNIHLFRARRNKASVHLRQKNNHFFFVHCPLHKISSAMSSICLRRCVAQSSAASFKLGAARAFSTTPIQHEVKKLGVIGAGQMVSVDGFRNNIIGSLCRD